jgi:hypothetical protein
MAGNMGVEPFKLYRSIIMTSRAIKQRAPIRMRLNNPIAASAKRIRAIRRAAAVVSNPFLVILKLKKTECEIAQRADSMAQKVAHLYWIGRGSAMIGLALTAIQIGMQKPARSTRRTRISAEPILFSFESWITISFIIRLAATDYLHVGHSGGYIAYTIQTRPMRLELHSMTQTPAIS